MNVPVGCWYCFSRLAILFVCLPRSTDIFGIILVAVFCFAMVSSYFRGVRRAGILITYQCRHSLHQSSKLGTSLLFGRGSKRVRAQASGYDGFCFRFSHRGMVTFAALCWEVRIDIVEIPQRLSARYRLRLTGLFSIARIRILTLA